MMEFVSNDQSNLGGAVNRSPISYNDSPHSRDNTKGASPLKLNGDDTLTLSEEGQTQAAKEISQNTRSGIEDSPTPKSKGDSIELSPEELQQLQELKLRDLEVRTHEQAHMAAAGRYSQGGPSFSLQKGPDGRSYAVGGEVNIDVGKESTPEETVAKMRIIKQAALAPATPSSADRRIAAQASVKETQARQEMSAKVQEELLLSDRLPDDSSPSVSHMSDAPVANPAPSNSVGTLKTMLEAYATAAAF